MTVGDTAQDKAKKQSFAIGALAAGGSVAADVMKFVFQPRLADDWVLHVGELKY